MLKVLFLFLFLVSLLAFPLLVSEEAEANHKIVDDKEKVEDKTAPVITLTGSSTITIKTNAPYKDLGATALDDIDGKINFRIVTSGLPIDTKVAGTYFVKYDVSDAAGNKAVQVVRTVIVEEKVTEPAPPTADKTEPAPPTADKTESTSSTADNTQTPLIDNEGPTISVQPKGTDEVILSDITAPKILQPQNVIVDAEDASGARVAYGIPVANDNVGITELTCLPFPGSFFNVGVTQVTCTAKDAAGNTSETSFNVYVKKYTSLQIHGWVKLIGEFWCNDQINELEFVLVIQYLIDEKIINIPDIESGSEPSNSKMPPWLKNVTCWWSQDQIPDEEFAAVIQYLVKENIIAV